MDIINRTVAAIKKYSMLSGGEKVLIGLSGGADSTCLTIILKKITDKFRLSLHAVYIDHGLRPKETPGEASFVKEFSESLGIPFSIRHVDVKSYAKTLGLNVQEAARQLRYQALDELSIEIKADRIALGHTLDDQVETFFMRILRGSGTKGLSAIPPVRGIIMRPLIEIEREDIERFLIKERRGFITDSSNLKENYLRNRIRYRLMPELQKLEPGIMRTLAHATDIFREEDRFLDVATAKAIMKLISRKRPSAIELFLSPLETMDIVILRRVLRKALEETESLRGISAIHIEDIINLVRIGRPGDRVYLPRGIRVIKQYATLLITSEPPQRLGRYVLESEGEVLLTEAGLVIKAAFAENIIYAEGKSMVVLDGDKVSFPLTVRARENGDFFYPAAFGKRKKLQDFFVDSKVPRDERDNVPIVTSGDKIIWVAGYRGDERFMASVQTKRYITLEILRAK